MHRLGFCIFLATAACLTACITSKEKKDMQADIFNLQTRLLTLERDFADTLKESKGSADTAVKRIASTRAEVDRLTSDMQKVRGDIDALRIGVVTGKMPGTDAAQEGSVAVTLSKLESRLTNLEQTQTEILEAINKAGVKKNSKKSAARKTSTSIGELQESFDAKKYKIVTEDAQRFIKEGDSKSRAQAYYLLAESYFKLGDMRTAALKFNEFLETDPPKNFIPLAKMRLGDCFRNLGDSGTAKIYYEELINDFPDSNEAAKAKERLAEINGGSGESKKG